MQLPSNSRPTWVDVSLPALVRNFELIRRHVGPGVMVCAVVKADAYGHGAAECARALQQAGATWFGVTSTDEGVRLREAGIEGGILLMTGFWRGEQEAVLRHRLTPAVWQQESLELLEGVAGKLSAQAKVHVKVDTGMSRLGVEHDKVAEFCKLLPKFKQVRIEGVFTHLASSEILDSETNAEQLARFDAALSEFRRQGINPPIVHAANSSAIAGLPQSHYNFVRPGISLYGYYLPFVSSTGRPSELRGLAVEPVLSWKTRITGLRQVASGAGVGYGSTYTARRPMTIAVLPVGYADGLNRQLSSMGRVLVRGEVAPIIGRVSMDVTLIDVSAIRSVGIGDEVVIIGRQGEHRLDAWEHATLAHTIPYETLCAISARVPRRYCSSD
ncbi:MAG TPA: alanine racemase [Terriglobales bacterium]|nr:alanine racemase [Terriglobales bacterium]